MKRLVWILIILGFLWQGIGVCAPAEESILRPALVCGEKIEEVVGIQDTQADLLIKDEVEKIRMGLVRHELGNIFVSIYNSFYMIRHILENSGIRNLSELCERIENKWRNFSETLDISIFGELVRTTNNFFTRLEVCLNENGVKNKSDREDIREFIENFNLRIQDFLLVEARLSMLSKFRDINKLIEYYETNFECPEFSSELCSNALKFEKEHKDEPIIIIGIISNLVRTAGRVAYYEGVPYKEYRGANIKIKTIKENDEWIRIEVSDTGPGFPEEILHRVFKEEVTTKDYDEGGKGLKLTGDYILWKRAKIQLDTKNRLGEVYRLVLDGRLKKRIFGQILDGSGRKEVGTTVTLWLPAEKIFGYRVLNRVRKVVHSL